ncbi:MAG: NAD-dependent DNA ligase LigA [Firmicutes bacterium]|nr:NAD-dependent DNA ligase LigA [Bacillota bacterium]
MNEINGKNEIKARIDELRREVEESARLYYVYDSPKISDFEYDAMFSELLRLEEENPEFDSPTSPTKRVGGAVLDGFEKVTHKYPLQSLSDVFSYDELRAFTAHVREIFPDAEFSVEPKIDGLSVSLEYVGGRLYMGATRGNGSVGENVTENLKTVMSIPLSLTNDEKLNLTVRGEVFMPREAFARQNEARELAGKPLMANPRNAAAGSLRQLDSKVAASRGLDIFVFNFQGGELYSDGRRAVSHSETLSRMKELGFKTIPYETVVRKDDEIIAHIEKIGEMRDNLSFDIDGAVIKVDSLSYRERLGEGTIAPKWAAAYKYPPEKKETKLLDIVSAVGRTGVVTPAAVLEPVKIAGSTVSRATLHNIDIIRERDVRIGDTVILQKAGDIIPEIIGAVKEKRTGCETVWNPPSRCPSCGEPLVFDDGDNADGGTLRCINASCPAQRARNIEHFAERGAMDIESLGSALVSSLIENGLIFDAADLYYLDRDRVASLDRMGQKSADNLMKAIEKSKSAGLSRLINALGIRQIGTVAAAALAEKFGTIDAIISASVEELCEVDDIGEISADMIRKYFDEPKNLEFIEKLRRAGVVMEDFAPKKRSDTLSGLTFVLTGTLPTMTRDEASAKIKEAGGNVTSSVSKKTSYVVAGDSAGSKLERAVTLGIPVISESELLSMINGE